MSRLSLVTGGAGFVGSHLVDRLLARGDRVRVLDDLLPQAHPSGVARFLSKEAELVVGDLRDRAMVDRALEGVESVFHLGGMVGNGQSMVEIRRYLDVNAVGTATLLEGMVARRAQFRRLVVASSMVVYGDGAYRCPTHGPLSRVVRTPERLRSRQWEPVCPDCGAEVSAIATGEEHALHPTSTYGVSKLSQEQLALCIGRAYRLPTIALRYLNIYGSRQALGNPYTGLCAIIASRLLNGRRPLIFEDGQQRRDLVHVSDVVEANLRAETAPESACHRSYNIGTGRSVTVLELAGLLGRLLGSRLEPELRGEHREGDIRHCFADVSLARKELGFEARTSLSDGAVELARWAASERPEDVSEAANRDLRQRGMIR